jgi:preprotein translocase subunit YajC
MAEFFANYGLFILLAVLLVFMFWNSRKRMQKQKLEQEAKARQTVPGAEVLLQGGLYGTIVAYDPENLDQPAEVEIAPGTVIKVHSQAILRVVEPVAETELVEEPGHDAPAIETIDDVAAKPVVDPETGKKTED